MPIQQTIIRGHSGAVEAGTIVSSNTGQPVSFAQMIADLATVQVVYVGEQHTCKEHHATQLQVIEYPLKSAWAASIIWPNGRENSSRQPSTPTTTFIASM